MNTTPADLNRRRRIDDAIAALNLIDCDDIKALDDRTLNAFDSAIRGLAAFTEVQIDLRQWTRSEAWTMRESADTNWPDALESAA